MMPSHNSMLASAHSEIELDLSWRLPQGQKIRSEPMGNICSLERWINGMMGPQISDRDMSEYCVAVSEEEGGDYQYRRSSFFNTNIGVHFAR